jgi:CRP-like cAMP-binding protein
MVERQSFQSGPVTWIPPRDRKCAASPQHAARHNRLLAALPPADFKRLLPDLEPVPLPLGWTVHGDGDRENYLYFLTAGIVCRFYISESGESTEFAITGREGVIGIPSFLGGGSMPSQAVVVSAGYAYRLGAQLLKGEFDRGGSMQHLLLRYTQALLTQMAQAAVCNRHHSVDQQFCRWLLRSVDCLPSNELTMTQELIANMLGVRREGITEAAGRLQNAGLIEYRRGHITVLDRLGVEARACECYAVAKKEIDRLLPEAID